MFDLPDAKRVRRSDLYTRSSQSPSPAPSTPDPELEARLHSRLAGIYGEYIDSSSRSLAVVDRGIDPPTRQAGGQDGEVIVAEMKEGEEERAHEFEFRLFSSAGRKHGSMDGGGGETRRMIVIDDEDLGGGEGGFIVKERSAGYFIAGKAEGERKREFEFAAMSWEDLMEGKRKRAWGLEVPWRVTVIKVPGKGRDEKRQHGGGGEVLGEGGSGVDIVEEGKRKRPGKKRRIILRERMRKTRQLKEQRRKEIELREQAQKEKRTRRNREKKVKRKVKDKAKKATAGAGVDTVGDKAELSVDDAREPAVTSGSGDRNSVE